MTSTLGDSGIFLVFSKIPSKGQVKGLACSHSKSVTKLGSDPRSPGSHSPPLTIHIYVPFPELILPWRVQDFTWGCVILSTSRNPDQSMCVHIFNMCINKYCIIIPCSAEE